MIFVPESKVKSLSEKHPEYFIRSNKSLPVQPFKTSDKIKKLISRYAEKKASFDFLGDTFLQGSTALGLNLDANSDKDYIIKAVDREDAIDKSIKLLKKYPQFRASRLNSVPGRDVLVYKGQVNGAPVDIAFD